MFHFIRIQLRRSARLSSVRAERGGTLALVACLTGIIIFIGLFCLYMMQLFGGSRELQNATDSGNLNVAKQAFKKPCVTLNQGIEQDNFGGLTDNNGNVSLSNYNRLVSQSLLVALNAQSEGTTEAQHNVETLVQALQSGDANVSQRLHDALASADGSRNSFSQLTLSNSTRMLPTSSVHGVDSSYSTAYVDKGEPTNIYIDPNILPQGASLPNGATSAVEGKSFINGYTDIKVGQMPDIAGATLHPGQQPHLISQRDFQGSVTNNLTAGAVPPNSFQSAALASDASRGSQLTNFSCSTVGALNVAYQASIPRGYLVVNNPAGYQFNGQLPNPDSIYNNQLYTGIYLANNGAFSTNRDALEAWVNYNANPGVGNPPALDNIYNANGDPLNAAYGQGISSLGGGPNNYPVEADYTMASGDGAIPQVVAMLPAFEKAYDAQNGQSGSPTELTAVEDLKGEVMNMFAEDQSGMVSAPTGYSGLRLFNHGQPYPVPAGSPPLITDSGNTLQLLNQVGDTAVLPQIKQRIHEIKPNVSDDEINNLLQSNLLGLGTTWYIYMDQQTGTLTMSQTPPAWVSTLPQEYQNGTAADGNPTDSSSVFETIGYSVDPQGEAGFSSVLYDVTSNPSSSGLGNDEALFTPSSGFNNLLGTLQFRESITSVLAAYTPPAPITTTPTTTPATTPPATVATTTPITNGCNCNCTFAWDAAVLALGPNATASDAWTAMQNYSLPSLSFVDDVTQTGIGGKNVWDAYAVDGDSNTASDFLAWFDSEACGGDNQPLQSIEFTCSN